MADGAVLIDVGMNVSKAEKELDKLKQKIIKTEQELGKNTEQRSAIQQEIADVSARLDEATEKVRTLKEEYSKSKGDTKAGLKVQLAEALEDQRALTGEANRLNREYDAVSRSIGKGTEQLASMKEQAGGIERALESQRSGGMGQVAATAQAASAAMKTGIKNILKWGLGIRSAFILARRLRSAIVESVKAFADHDDETKNNINSLKSALGTLKISWGAAFAPILNVVTPILQTLISWLTAAANALQAFFAILGGKSSYKKVVNNNNELAKSYGGAGGAAAEAKKEILGFDEINKLSDDSGGGGGGGGGAQDAIDFVDELIDAESFLSKLAISFSDVFFEWKDLNPEQIAKKIITGVFAVLGAVLAISLGLGPGGIIVLSLLGAALGIVISSLIFNNDGKIGKTEIIDMVILAINTILGGVLGFAMTRSFKGAMIGATIGAGLWVAIKGLKLKKDNPENGITSSAFLTIINGIVGAGIVFNLVPSIPGAILGAVLGVGLTLGLMAIRLKEERTQAFYESELGQQVQDIKDKVAHVMEVDQDLTVRINSITGEVDQDTLVNLYAAEKLVQQIFDLDSIENKTPEQIALLKQNIESLNGLGLEGVNVAFDEATGHVTTTRQEVQGLLDDMLKQYQIKAMEEAYVESYKAQYEATKNVEEATVAAQGAQANLKQATNDLTTAQEDYNTALSKWNEYKDQWSGFWTNGESDYANSTEYQDLQNAQKDLEAAKTAFEETKKSAEESATTLETSMETYSLANEKVAAIGESLVSLKTDAKTAGEDTVKGYSTGVTDNISDAEDATRTMGEDALESLRAAIDSHSPSQETMKIGGDFMEGFALGVKNKASHVTQAVQSAMAAATEIVTNMVAQMKAVWQSDWGRPKIHLPVFGLSGMFDFQTGMAPQVVVQDWLWMAKGGILDSATLIGAGEDGKEAIVPLERHTEWITLVADKLLDSITRSSRLTDLISGMQMPALASGQVVPPRALSGGGSVFSDGDIERLVSGIASVFTGSESNGGDLTIKLYLDGRQIAETVTKHQRRMERGR